MTCMKRNSHTVRSQTMRHVKSYLNGTSIVDLARRCNYPPSLMARLIVENVTRSSSSSSSSSSPATEADNVKEEAQSTVTNPAIDSNDANNHHRGDGGVGGGISRRFLTNALRYPEKFLGDARASISPEYLFSERNGPAAVSAVASAALPRRDVDREAIPLSRLSREVREAVDCDPLYGEFLHGIVKKNWCGRIEFAIPLSAAQR